jgi:asparagine synthase (glutamine-hydrolysing)
MCGIVAIFSNENPIAAESLARATESLSHRGPDEQHTWIAPHGRAALGHTRLSIIDLVTGSQPIANEDGSLRIVVNGEFYDFEKLRGELEKRGHRFSTRSDSEIALHLYEEMGPACLEHLRGEFAFVIWDEKNEQLFAARDRFGIKPLFYTRFQGTLYLASEIEALFSAGVPAHWDQESMFQNLFLSVDQDRSLFNEIRQLPAGHYLIARPRSIDIVCYWDVNYPRASEQNNHNSEAVCVERLRFLLDEAVRLRMRADVPVGCYVSGGVDSSSVLGLASRQGNGRLTTFTVAFDTPDFNESATAQRTAAHVGANFIPVEVTEADFADVFVEAVEQGEMVHYNAHGAARYHLSRAVQQAGYKVVLAGEGADELFAGYEFSRQALLTSGANGDLLKWPRMLLRLARPKNLTEQRIARTSPWLERISRGLALSPTLLDYVAEKFELLHSMLATDFAAEFQRRDPYREFFRQFKWRSKLIGREPVKQILYLWMKSVFVNYVLAGERLDMAHAVEVRLPFLDHKLFEFARSIPATLLARNGGSKYLLREAVRPFVTDEVYQGKKQPFFAPPMVIGNPMYQLLQDLLRSENFKSVPFFDQPSVIRFLDELPAMDDRTRRSMDPILFMMASITVLHSKLSARG